MSRNKIRRQLLAIGAATATFGLAAHADTVGYWRFEEGAADTPASGVGSIFDSSGNGNNGTPLNGPIYSSMVPVSVIPNTGFPDLLSMSFNGTNQSVVIPDSLSLQNVSSLTLEAYIKPVSTSGLGNVIFRGDDRGGLDPYRLSVSSGDAVFQVTDANNNSASVQALLPASNPWTEVAGTLDNATGTMDLYLNGTLAATTTTTIRPFGQLTGSEPGVAIGNTQSQTGVSPEYFHGLIDEVRISNAALTPAQFLEGGNGSAPGPSQWAINASGDWNNPSNWTGAVPNAAGAEADLLGSITKAHTVFTDVPITVGTIHFNNANTYVLTGAGNLTLQGAAGTSALVQVDQGTQELNLPMTVAGNTNFNVASGATLLVANPLTINSGANLSQSGSGTVTYQSILTVQTGGTVAFANSTIGNTFNLKINAAASIAPNSNAQLQFNTVSIGSGAKFDIANNALAVNFASPVSDPVQSIAGYLATGYLNGLWTGTGINSSTAASNPSVLAVGYADGNTDSGTPAAANQVLVKYTLAGDANLDGLVNFQDLVAVVQNFNRAGTDWAQGNFGYGAATGFEDLVAVVQNFNKMLTPAGNVVEQAGNTTLPLALSASVQATDVQLPEPAALGILALGSSGLLGRRRKRISRRVG